MSDYEEPPAKMAKVEDSCEELEEGQEEWLSESILTDDDYNPGTENDESITNPSQDETMVSIPEESLDVKYRSRTSESGKTQKLDYIEETLVHMENVNEEELPGGLGTFLIRKSEGKVLNVKEESEQESPQHSDDDGHDTDELLRMLGDDEQKVKKEIRKLPEKKIKEHSSDDDDFYKGAKISRLKVAKKTIIKKEVKAESEETSDRDGDNDMSSDEGTTVQKIFNVRQRTGNFAAKSTSKSSIAGRSRVKVYSSQPNAKPKSPGQKIGGPQVKSKFQAIKFKEEEKHEEEEFLDEDQFDEEFLQDDKEIVSSESHRQAIMFPEEMDEEVPSDEESIESDEESLYDELPSSDTEDCSDWFTLDIRAERASDYIPLLGPGAYAALCEEKRRVSGRVSGLRRSLAALAGGARARAEQLRRAARALAEADAALKAT